MSWRRGRNRSQDSESLFTGRPDLLVIGFVFVKPEYRAGLSNDDAAAATVTLWGRPGNPETLNQVKHQESQGREPAALILITAVAVEVQLMEEWRSTDWFKEYVEGLAKDIHHEGPENFFAAMVPLGGTTPGSVN